MMTGNKDGIWKGKGKGMKAGNWRSEISNQIVISTGNIGIMTESGKGKDRNGRRTGIIRYQM